MEGTVHAENVHGHAQFPSSPSPTNSPQPKRRKIRVACGNCRSNKTRCDGETPVCVACQRRGLSSSCVYQPVQPTTHQQHHQKQKPRDQPAQRVNTLSQRHSPRHGQTDDVVLPYSTHNDHAQPTERTSTRGFVNGVNGEQTALDTQDPYKVDALATVNSAEDDDCLYGGSSTIAFVQQFAKKQHAGTKITSPQNTSSSGGRNIAQRSSYTLSPRPDFSLNRNETLSVYPARRKADDFLRCFWEFVHPVFPAIHKTLFIAQYEKIWVSGDADTSHDNKSDVEEVIFSTNLNLIFALGCQFSTLVSAARKRFTADEFYQRSRGLFHFDVLDSNSISIVQMLLLTGVYLQSTPYANRCWNSIGLAIRTAQSQGLHLDYAGRRPESQLNCQMRRRIWHTCVILDRLVAMTFGRPTMVSNSWTVPIPTLVDDEYLQIEGEGAQPDGVPCRLGLFVSSCKLFEILHDILLDFYATDTGLATPRHKDADLQARDILVDVMKFSRRLDMFYDSIPEYLCTDRSSNIAISERNNCINLQQQVLYCRFLYTKLLSLRPLLLLATKNKSYQTSHPANPKALSSSLDEDFVKHCCSMCVTTAHRLVETLHQHLDTAYKSSGWHSVYFTFASATILLAGWKCQEIDTQVRHDSFEMCWNQCLSILDHYKEQIHSAPRAIHVLCSLKDQVMNEQTHVAENARNPMDTTTESVDYPWIPDSNHFNFFGTDSITDAWFGQQLVNLDWMDLPFPG